MRQILKQIGRQERHQFKGTFVRTGVKSYGEHYQPTLLRRDLFDQSNRLVTDHLWLNYTLGFLRLGELVKGDQVQFMARVTSYDKGPFGARQHDYKLERPTRVQRWPAQVSRLALPIEDRHVLIGYIMVANQQFYQANGRPFEDYYVAAFRRWSARQAGQLLAIQDAKKPRSK